MNKIYNIAWSCTSPFGRCTLWGSITYAQRSSRGRRGGPAAVVLAARRLLVDDGLLHNKPCCPASLLCGVKYHYPP